jgi:hypothetical protein
MSPKSRFCFQLFTIGGSKKTNFPFDMFFDFKERFLFISLKAFSTRIKEEKYHHFPSKNKTTTIE